MGVPRMSGRRCLIIPDKARGKCLHLEGGETKNGTKILLSDQGPPGHLNQEWLWDGLVIRSAKAPEKCLHLAIEGGAAENGTKIQLWDFDARPRSGNQEWKLD